MTSTSLLLLFHGVASLALAVFGGQRLLLALRHRRRLPATRPEWPAADLPRVTVQIPVYNERYVVERAILAASALRYPRDRIEIQVLDDSDDDTTTIATRTVAGLRDEGHAVTLVRRPSRDGYKAGALKHALTLASGELVAIFDADFVPPPDFLQRLLPEFRDPRVGMVQARWEHLNERMSWLTRTQAIQLDAHFTVEHGVRAASGLFFNFNGTAGIWRRAAIEDAGGWQGDTLTEDLDLSYRAQLAGWECRYRDDVGVPAELPVEIAAYRIQQARWAQGGLETARKLLPALLRAPLPAAVKRSAAAHLLIHVSYPLLVFVTLAGLTAAAVDGLPAFRWVLLVDAVLLGFAMVSLTVFYGVAARTRHPLRWKRRLLLVPLVMLVGAGISLSQSLAVARGWFGTATPFRRTPKYRLESAGARAWRAGRYRLHSRPQALLELGTGALLCIVAGAVAFTHGLPPSGLVILLGAGLLAVGSAGLRQQRPRRPGSA